MTYFDRICRHSLLACLIVLPLSGSAVKAQILSLPEGLGIVAEKSRQVSIGRSDEQIAEIDVQTAMSRLLPTVQASAAWMSLAHQPAALFGPRPVPLSERNYLSCSLSVQQTLFDFSGNASRYNASKALLSARKYETQRIRNFAAIEFVLAYLDLLEAEKMISVSENEVEALEAHRKKTQNLYDEGVITRNDLLQAEVKISDSRQRLLSVRTLREIQASRLNNILLRPLKTLVSLQDIEEPQGERGQAIAVETAWELAEQQRAELKIADETLRALGLEKAAKKSEFFPRMFVRGGFDFTENRYQVHEDNWSVTLGLNMNLFSGGLTRAEIRKLEFQAEKLAEQRAKLLDEIHLEVQQYLLQSVTARERLHVTKDAVRQAEENLRINRVQYEEGIGTGTDVLDAVALLSSARTNYFRALYDLRKAEAAVYYATGKDLLEVYR
ncbi:MAG: TolC family protein [Nitrospirae bacterium]|nr:TolC family protein [Nitrospirota bacterium]